MENERLKRIVVEHLDALSHEEWVIYLRYFGLQIARDDNDFLQYLVERKAQGKRAGFRELLQEIGLAAHVGPRPDHPIAGFAAATER